MRGAAKLRVDTTALGPISVALNQNGPQQRINATNAGDTALSLKAASSASWLAASVEPLQPCGLLGACVPITISLNTASLAKGSYTGFVTLSDAAAIDAPQTISVTVLVGGGVPDTLTFFVPSTGQPVSQTFTAARSIGTSVTSPPAVNISVAAPSAGSFASIFSYTVTAAANAGAAPGNYSGSIAVSGSSVGNENKTVPVAVTVTTLPIASTPAPLGFRIAQGAAKQTQFVAISNLGSGTLGLTGATAASSGGTWLTSSIVNGLVSVTAESAGLQPGTYTGTATIASNAANSSITVPVSLQVLATGPPTVIPGGVLNNATFTQGATLARGDLPAIFGEQLITGDAQSKGALPWGNTLGGAAVFVNDQPAPVYFVSPSQINFQIPYGAQTGEGTLRVERDGQRSNAVSINISPAAPRFLVAVNESGAIAANPFAPSLAPVKAGTYIVIYSLGFGQTSPPVKEAAAAPSDTLAVVPGKHTVYFGNGGLFQNPASQTPLYVGLTPGFAGLYQVNVQVPENAPRGTAVPVFLIGDAGTTNSLLLNIQ